MQTLLICLCVSTAVAEVFNSMDEIEAVAQTKDKVVIIVIKQV